MVGQEAESESVEGWVLGPSTGRTIGDLAVRVLVDVFSRASTYGKCQLRMQLQVFHYPHFSLLEPRCGTRHSVHRRQIRDLPQIFDLTVDCHQVVGIPGHKFGSLSEYQDRLGFSPNKEDSVDSVDSYQQSW